MNIDVSASIVLYRTPRDTLERVARSFLNTKLSVRLLLVDNHGSECNASVRNDPRVEYLVNRGNIGYGGGHNVAIRRILGESEFHLVLNPDVYFEPGTLETITEYMRTHPSAGHLMPRVLYPNGDLQYLCKLLPTPADLFARRFVPIVGNASWMNRRYELRDFSYDRTLEVPSLSGCFMFLRTEALKRVGCFDERFFMYAEDIDLSRRVGDEFRNVYFPSATVVHEHARESYRSVRLLAAHVQSIVKYFNKWGWFFDRTRRSRNHAVLEAISATKNRPQTGLE